MLQDVNAWLNLKIPVLHTAKTTPGLCYDVESWYLKQDGQATQELRWEGENLIHLAHKGEYFDGAL